MMGSRAVFAVLMGACIIAQLSGGWTEGKRNEAASTALLQSYERKMTTNPEVVDKLSRAGSLRDVAAAAAVSLLTALLVIAPFFWLGNASGHDIAFHASSWLDVAGQWKEGIVYPRWAEWANHGFGEPRFIFYPPLSWMLGAALGFVVPWNAVPMVFIVLAQTLAGVSLFALARRFLPRGAALLGAAIYAANPYALLIIYMRSDFAELLACAFLPLVVLGAMRLAGLVEEREISLGRKTALFAMAFAGMWLSNAPAAVIASYSVAIIFGWSAISLKSWRPLLRGAGGLGLGFGLASFYLVPAVYEQQWVNIGQALSSGLLPSQNFLYTVIADAEHNDFNWVASNAAVLLVLLVCIGGILARGVEIPGIEPSARKKVWGLFVALSAAGIFLMVRVSSIFWEYLPKLRFVQFPWRWMAVLAVVFAYFGAAVVARKKARWVFALVAVVAIVGAASLFVQRAWWDSEDIPVLRAAIAEGQGYDGTDEYDPIGDDHTDLPVKAERVQILPGVGGEGEQPRVKFEIQKWTAEEKIVTVSSGKPERVALRLLNYPAWRVEVVHDGVMSPGKLEESSRLILRVPGGESLVRVRFVKTSDRTIGIVLSMVAVGILLLLATFRPSRERLAF
jgi:hypothetical protein